MWSTWGRAFLCLAAVVVAATGCRRAAAPDPTFDVELAESGGAESGAASGEATWITIRAVVLGSRVVSEIVDGGPEAPRAEVALAVEAQRGDGPIILGVDRRASFGAAWSVLSERHRDTAAPVSLLVGDKSSPSRIDVCGALGRRRPGPITDDCWGRREGRPPPSTGSRAGDAGVADRPNGDGLVSPSVDLSAPLRLEVLLGTEAVSLRVQGRVLRVLERRGPRAGVLDALAETLESFRRRNEWERRATVRVSSAVAWGDVVALLDRLRGARFDQIRLESALE